jgi:predicted membrane channel-forming protein YqfA (hemolysin III family)
MSDSDGLTDKGKLLFGAGFVFGVTTTLLIFGVVLVAVTDTAGADFPTTVVATLAGGVLFAAIVGVGLYYLAFPENRTRIAVDPARFGLDDEE